MEIIKHFFPDLTEDQVRKYDALQDLYIEWNNKINVISRKDLDQFYVHHVLHSLAIAKVIQFEPSTLILDVGTGGGFPAIPLAILFPRSQFLAVDSIQKKIKVVSAIIDELKLDNIEARSQRVEQLEEKFDFIVSRAVAKAERIIGWVNDSFRSDSFNSLKNGFLFLKGGELEAELSETGKAFFVHEIAQFFPHDFFETKKVAYIPS